MDSSFGGGFTQSGGTGEVIKERKTEGTLPMFISQIHQQKFSVVNMWGFEYKMITTVAIVRNIQHSSTKITYDLEDWTGTITAHYWVEEDAATTTVVNINSYVRIIGSLREQGDTKLLMVVVIRPIKNINEINTHYLEVVNARYQAEDYYRGGSGAISTAMETETSAKPLAASNPDGVKDGKNSAIYKVIHESGKTYPDLGISRNELYKTFPHISETEMVRILDNLAEGGHIYATIDADHFLGCY